MVEEKQISAWKRVAAGIGLLCFLSFWVASAGHLHSAATHSSVRQECQLCVVSNANQPVITNSPLFHVTLVALSILFVPEEYPANLQDTRPFPPRSPPFSA